MTVPTLLPIYSFAKVLGLNPLHVMGVDANIGAAASRVCVHPIGQYSWQTSDGVSREELSWAIYEAEQDLARELGYWPGATWQADERIDIEQPGAAWYRSMYDIRGDLFSVKTRYGQLISGGRRVKSLIDDAVAIVYTDTDSDTYFETATISVATTVTDPEEIAVYYPGLSGDDEWEVRPIQVSIAGGTATITCRREQLVTKAILESLAPEPAVAGLTNANFLTTVDVYRKYHDPSVQGQLVWRAIDACGCNGEETCETCGLTIQTACTTVKDKKLGLITLSPGTWNADDEVYEYAYPDVCSRRPDYVRMWYRSGYRDMSLSTPNNTLDRRFQLAIAKLAVSKLDRLICSCQGVSDVQSHWSADLRRTATARGGSSTYKVSNYELENNPFGTTVAAMDVWRLVRREGLGVTA
jgi:hypothetical protein